MSSPLKQSFLLNLLIILVLFSAIIFGVFKSLNSLTRHGEEAKVPLLTGRSLLKVKNELKDFEIQVDSTYVSYKDPLEIIFQEPQPGSTVKKGRTIFITVNKQSPPTVPMPKITDMSFRNAVLTLQSYRLIVGDTLFKPDIAAGAILEQNFNGKKIIPGTPVPIGSKIDLVVGAGLSEVQIDVPNLIGLTFAEAKSILDAKGLSYFSLFEGSITDSNSAIIYKQEPEAVSELDLPNSITSGDMIDLRIMQRPSEELIRMNQPGSSKYTGLPPEADVATPPTDPANESQQTPVKKDEFITVDKSKIPGMGPSSPSDSKEADDKDKKNVVKKKKIKPKAKSSSSSSSTKSYSEYD